MRRLLAALLLLGLAGAPAAAQEAPVLGIMPPYPGAKRPLPHWERGDLAIAVTPDKAERVIAYYINRLTQAGWHLGAGHAAEAYAAALAGEPAWLTFQRAGSGRVDLQITQAKPPQTATPLTFIFYQSQFKP